MRALFLLKDLMAVPTQRAAVDQIVAVAQPSPPTSSGLGGKMRWKR